MCPKKRLLYWFPLFCFFFFSSVGSLFSQDATDLQNQAKNLIGSIRQQLDDLRQNSKIQEEKLNDLRESLTLLEEDYLALEKLSEELLTSVMNFRSIFETIGISSTELTQHWTDLNESLTNLEEQTKSLEKKVKNTQKIGIFSSIATFIIGFILGVVIF